MRANKFVLSLPAVGLLLTALTAQQSTSTTELGAPLPGLTSDQLARFTEGQDVFQEVETVEDGLGPVFNEASCATCHITAASTGPAVGGTNGRLETRFGATTSAGFDPMTYLGGSLLQDHGIGGPFNNTNFQAETVPPGANVVALRRTTPLFGLGLVDAVPDQTFRTLAFVERILSPRTAGTVSVVTNISTGKNAVGKFGWKNQNPTLFQFSADAYLNEMGITSPQFPEESCPQGNCAMLADNPVPTMNDDGDDVEKFADFMTFLAPPPRGRITSTVQTGEKIFQAIGCANCHIQTLTTGRNSVVALNQVTFHPFSDFLLHDMGSLGDGIVQGIATGRLMRTAPLWGLRFQTSFLHDGRVSSIQGAINAHAGQGSTARDRYGRMTREQKAALLAFLQSL